MRLVLVVIDGSFSDFCKQEGDSDEYGQARRPTREASQSASQVAPHLTVPVLQAFLIEPEQYTLFAKRHGNRQKPLELSIQRSHLLLLLCGSRRILGRWLFRQFVALASQSPQTIAQRCLQVAGSFRQRLGLRDCRVDGTELTRNSEKLFP